MTSSLRKRIESSSSSSSSVHALPRCLRFLKSLSFSFKHKENAVGSISAFKASHPSASSGSLGFDRKLRSVLSHWARAHPDSNRRLFILRGLLKKSDVFTDPVVASENPRENTDTRTNPIQHTQNQNWHEKWLDWCNVHSDISN